MPKRIALGVIFLFGLLWAQSDYYRFYLPGYSPVIENKIDVYKLYNGMNVYRTKPYEIDAFAPDYSEEINFADQTVLLKVQIGDFPLEEPVTISFDRYFANMMYKSFHKSMAANIKTQTAQTQVASTGVFGEWKLEIPAIAIPKAVQKVLGNKPGVLNLDGTQKVSFSGSSTKRKQIPIYETQANSRFDLKMEQETNLRLSGTIGEKINVNFKYNSKQDEQIFDANNINLKYTGNEDEIVQSIEGGNISLSLSGSRYISYSTSSQGLFGITSRFKYGNLDLNVIASKEEGEKNTQTYIGQSQADSTIVRSKDYAPRTMFYLWDPYQLYQLYGSGDGGVPAGWRDNAIKTSPSGAWLIRNPDLLPANGSVRLFLDDGNGNNNNVSAIGDTIFFSPTNYYVPYYDELIEGTDFVTDYDSGIITINRSIDRLYTLAVKYTQRDAANSPVPYVSPAEQDDGLLHLKVLRRRNQSYEPYDPADSLNVWHYQMRNIYNMNKTNIKSDGFSLQVYTLNADLTRNFNIPDSLATPGFITYMDYLRLDSNGDGLINGDDNTVNLATGLIIMPFLEPFKPLGDEIVYQDENEMINYLDIDFYISIKGKIGRDAIDLAQGGILKGSVRVRVNGADQKENVDYIVDYDFGRITFLSAAGKDPDAKIEIDFEYRSMFQVARKSLAGIRADYSLSDNAKLGATVVYRSESVADKRPRIGNENIEMLMADLDGTFTVKPAFITRWLDALPLINTSTESQVNFSGEVAFTFPHIYGDPDGKKKEAYLDDMESIMDSYPLGVTFSSWALGSKPSGIGLAKGHINWYNPKNIPREQIEDASTLTDDERKENVTVLAMKVFPNNLNIPKGNLPVQSWAGIMKYLGNQLDFSQKKYIEIMLKMEPQEGEPYPNATMHIDLGDISEDFYTDYGDTNPNEPNTEDTDHDGVLTLEEDIGLDNKAHGTPGADPNDLADNNQDQYGDYPNINGTEGNRLLDTEDLDGNGVLNKLNRYFTYSFSLSDSLSPLIQSSNSYGWRMYRIPITDPEYYQIVNTSGTNIQPVLKKISYARMWIDTDAKTRVLVSDVAVVGNKWQDFYVRDFSNNQIIPATQIAAQNTTYLSGIVSNQKNRSHYTSPPGTVYKEDNREASESSLSLSISNLPRYQQCLLRQRMLDSYSLLSYDKLRFWIYPESAPTTDVNVDSLDVIFRIGADSLNYYQVRQRVPVNDYHINPSGKMDPDKWIDMELVLQEMISLKELHPGATQDSLVTTGRVYYYKGAPTLTNIRDVYLGVYNPYDLDNGMFDGTVYFNDMRVINPYQEAGIAKRISLNTNLADFSNLTVDYEDKSENFNPTIQRGRSNTFTRTQNFNITNKYFLNKFFPNSWNLDIPLTLTRNYSLGIPRYQANSDLLLDNILDEKEKDRQKTESLLYSADIALSQKSAPRSKILQYTIYRTSLSARIEDSYRYAPTTIDTLLSYRGTLNYNLNIPQDKTTLKLFRNYRLGFLPNTFNNTFSYNGSEPSSFNWEKREELWDWYPRSLTSDTKFFTTDNNLSWSLLSDLTATGRWNTKRDLMQQQYYKDLNIGKLTEFVQDLGLNYNPSLFPRIMNLTSALGARYSDTQSKYTQTLNGEQVYVYERDGNTNRSLRMNLTLQNSNLFASLANTLKSKQPASPKTGEADYKDQGVSNPDEGKPSNPQNKQEEEYRKQLEEQGKLDELKKLEEEQNKLDMEEQKKLEAEQAEKDRLEKEAAEGEPTETEPKPEYTEEPPSTPADSTQTEPVKEPKAPKPPKPRINPMYVFLNTLSKVKNITASYQNTYIMSYNDLTDPFPFAFQIGIPNSAPRDSLDSISNDNTITFGSGLAISRKLDTVVNYSFTDNRRFASASNQSIGYTFPDVTVSLVDFESFLGLGKYLSSTRLNSGFQYSVRQTGDLNWIKPKQETYTTSINPLIGFTGNIMKVVSANISYSVSQTKNITDMDSYDIVKTADTQGINGNFAYSYRAGKGFTIPFTKRRIHIKNELSTTLGLVYEKNYDVTQGRESSQLDRHTTRVAITPGASYQFDTNIKGGLTSSYENTTDKKRDDGTRIFSLGIWVEITL